MNAPIGKRSNLSQSQSQTQVNPSMIQPTIAQPMLMDVNEQHLNSNIKNEENMSLIDQ